MTDSHDAPRIKLILLPGLDGTGQLFLPFIQALPPRIEALPVSYPPEDAYGYGDLLNLVLDCIPEEGPYMLLGESFSGPLALKAACRAVRAPAGVVLCASFVKNPLPRLSMGLKPFVRGSWVSRLTHESLLEFVLGREFSPDVVRSLTEALQAVRPEVLARRIQEILSVDATEDLRSCPAPLLYLSALQDMLVPPRNLEAIRKIRPDIKVEEFDAPHLLLQTKPLLAWKAVQTFIDRLNEAKDRM
jgi:pimeloyl-ACP methyl ester carboxylesterase